MPTYCLDTRLDCGRSDYDSNGSKMDYSVSGGHFYLFTSPNKVHF